MMFSAMSYGSISYNAHESLARAAAELGTYYNTGEGGLHEDFYQYGDHTIVQVASGRFGVHKDYLNAGAAIEIKMGQGAKPGIGGHLPGTKIVGDISRTRMIPEGSDAISPAPHHDIYSIEDLRQLVYSLKEATRYTKAGDRQDRRGAQRGGHRQRHCPQLARILSPSTASGAAPAPRPPASGITWASPLSWPWPAVDTRLRQEGIRNHVSLVVGGSIRSSADVVKAIALGADAVYIATGALLALGCHLCRSCHTGRCNWGIATQRPELVQRLNPDMGCQPPGEPGHRLEPRDQGDDGRHGHQLHGSPAWKPR